MGTQPRIQSTPAWDLARARGIPSKAVSQEEGLLAESQHLWVCESHLRNCHCGAEKLFDVF